MTPEEFFSSLRTAHGAATRVPVFVEECAMASAARRGRPYPQRKSRARLYGAPPPPAIKKPVPYFDVRRSDGKLLRITQPLLACFFDLTVGQACEAMLTHPAIIKRLRCWYGINCWPRGQVVGGTHPTFSLDNIRECRNSAMIWAHGAGEEVIYDSFVRALRLLAEDHLAPLSSDMLDCLDTLDIMASDFQDLGEAETDFPFSLPPHLMPEPEVGLQQPEPGQQPGQEPEQQPEPEQEPEQQQEPEPAPPAPTHPWDCAEDLADEDDDFFESLHRGGDSEPPLCS